jgi:hypothetical protein
VQCVLLHVAYWLLHKLLLLLVVVLLLLLHQGVALQLQMLYYTLGLCSPDKLLLLPSLLLLLLPGCTAPAASCTTRLTARA